MKAYLPLLSFSKLIILEIQIRTEIQFCKSERPNETTCLSDSAAFFFTLQPVLKLQG